MGPTQARGDVVEGSELPDEALVDELLDLVECDIPLLGVGDRCSDALEALRVHFWRAVDGKEDACMHRLLGDAARCAFTQPTLDLCRGRE